MNKFVILLLLLLWSCCAFSQNHTSDGGYEINLPNQNNAETNLLVRNSTTGKIEYRDATSIGTSGTYTPTLTNLENVDASTVSTPWFFSRVGNKLDISGIIFIDATTASATTRVAFSLPVASSLTDVSQLVGIMANNNLNETDGFAQADVTNDRGEIQLKTITAANQKYSITFSYQVL